jgi:hypothetical protein
MNMKQVPNENSVAMNPKNGSRSRSRHIKFNYN